MSFNQVRIYGPEGELKHEDLEEVLGDPDETGVYPEMVGLALRSQRPYSFPTYYTWRDRGHKADPFCTVYSDRLLQQDYDKYGRCAMEAWGSKAQYEPRATPEQVERFLQLYFDDETIRIVDIMVTCNVSNGFPIDVYRYRHES